MCFNSNCFNSENMIPNTGAFVGRTVFITGGSRGIGQSIGVKLAKDGANVVIAAKTVDKHPKLEGTIYSAAAEIEKAGGKCLPLQCDIREEEAVKTALDKAAQKFGGIDILVNNAGAIKLTDTESTSMKKYDLMHQINTRAPFMTAKYALPYLKKSSHAHILNLSPPLLLEPKWFKNHVAYTIAKYGMSMCVLGMAEEFKELGIGVNALWSRTPIATSAVAMFGPGARELTKAFRKPEMFSDAAYVILSKDPKKVTGQFFIDELVLRDEGEKDFDQYAVEPGNQLMADVFIPDSLAEGLIQMN